MPSKPTIPVVCEGCGKTFRTWPYKLRIGEGKVCGRACQGLRDRRAFPDRFWANVDRNGPIPPHCPEVGPCWLWTGHTVKGYGHVRFEGRQRQAHAVAYILSYGPLPAGKSFTCHRCDTRACVRPDHLFAGDQDSNMADMVAKGRAPRGNPQPARGARHRSITSPETLVRGSSHPNARLTEDIVRAARARYAAGGITLQALADWAGVSKATMARVISRRLWTHVI